MYNNYISPREKRTTRTVSVVSGVLFWIFCFSYLAISYRYLLSATEDLSLFVFDAPFFETKISQPGGMLLYLASFFTQFLYHPWLGALIITLFLQLIQYITYKAFNLNKKYMILSYIPSFLLLIIITNTGRSLYLMTHVEYMFTYILGTFILLLAYYIFQCISTTSSRLIALSLLLPSLFFGMSGSIAIYFFILVLLRISLTTHYKKRFVTCSLALLLYLVSFFIAAYLIYPHSAYHQVLFGVHPAIPLEQRWISLLPHFLLLFFFLFIALKQRFFPFKSQIKSYSRWTYTNLIGLSVFCALTASLANGYEDFRYEMVLDYSIEKRDFERAYLAGKGAHHPTREMTILRNFALVLSGKAGDKMFEYTQDWGTNGLFFDYKDGEPSHPSGAYIYSYLGANNLAKKWVNNNFCQKEYSFRMLNNFVLMAAVNGHWGIAEKVSNALQETLFHRDIAQKYHNLYKDSTLINKDPIIMDIRSRVSKKYYKFPSINEYTAFIDKFYIENPTNRVAYDYYMMSALLEKRLYKFVLGLVNYDNIYKGIPLPKHYVEALALYKHLYHKPTVKVDAKVEKLFNDYLKLKSEQKNPASEQNIMRRTYGETYWWYYMYKK